MVDGQVAATRLRRAVHARLTVAREHAAPRTGEPEAPGDLNIANEPDDERHFERDAACAQALPCRFYKLGFILQEKYYCTPD